MNFIAITAAFFISAITNKLNMTEVRIKGRVFIGVMRGSGIVEYHFHRIVGLVGFEPFKGTLNIKLERAVDMRHYATKAVEHILLDSTKKIDVLLAPIILTIKREQEEYYDCWAMRDMRNVYPDDVIELIARDNLMEKFSLKDDEEVVVTFFDTGKKKKEVPFMGAMRKLYGTEQRLSV